ncbi:Aldehyde dehydrogenase family 16 member A1 [Araneus ventricosus]|uniref:Aldehyde dehydrogenase family 16 member A1 n=1 Tax=Araneus ventricosus TaxID=182803 RepID=A0A4Y2QMH2_ARAVE|nr:Aldehyde dehydrogenase family 16 member A1 [Araneus ventricosus]
MNFSSVISKEDQIKIMEFFQSMADSPGIHSDKLAKDWLETHSNCFAGFVDNKWLAALETKVEISNPYSGERYADVCLPSPEILEDAVASSTKGFNSWKSLTGYQRSEYLLKIASRIEEYVDLFGLVECIASGKTLHRIKTKDVPNLVQSFNYYSNWAKLHEESDGCTGTGVICVIAGDYNEPCLRINWKISSILASGNAVLLLADLKSCFSAFLLAELCLLSGLPPGVLNVLPIDGSTLTDLPNVNKIVFSGALHTSNKIMEMASLQGIPFEISMSRQPIVIVYENADLHSAADGILEILYHSDTRSERSGCKVFIQASIQKKFLLILEEKFSTISVGYNLQQVGLTCIVTKEQKEQLINDVEEAKSQGIKVVEGPEVNADKGQFRATLLENVPITSILYQQVGSGPTIITTTFRTVKESISMFNYNKLGCDVSIWSEKLTLALEVANQLRAGTVWVNSQNIFDACAIYGGAGLGSSSLEGGKEAFLKHLNVGVSETKKYTKADAEQEIKLYGKDSTCGSSIKSNLQWESQNKYKISDILRKAAIALAKRKEEFASLLHHLTGEENAACSEEVEDSISRLHYWSVYIATSGGELVDTLIYGRVLKDRFPLGIIGIQSPDQKPFLSFITLVSSAIAFGNVVVVIPSENCSIPALKMCEIFQSSGIQSGVVNVVTGCRPHLTRHMCLNLNIDAVWYGVDGAAFINHSCTIHPKRVFDCKNVWRLKNNTNFKLILESTQIKTTYMPMGTIYAT